MLPSAAFSQPVPPTQATAANTSIATFAPTPRVLTLHPYGVVDVAGPTAESGPGHPLQLSRSMRTRLLAAVLALLNDPTLAGLPDSARLTALVLLAKAPAHSSHVRIRAEELGRWLGMSKSSVDHAVLPGLRNSKALSSVAETDSAGRVKGLNCLLLPLAQARASGNPAHPLALSRKELATLLRLCEALFAPGWAPKDGPVTPPGLLAERRGRGAATDRLALLLLVLATRPDGKVCLVGGSVRKKRGRPAATMARMLGCSDSGGREVLQRLQALGLVVCERAETSSGTFGKGRLWVPAVAAAHRSTRGAAVGSRADRLAEIARGRNGAASQRRATALGDQGCADDVFDPGNTGGSTAHDAHKPEMAERRVTAHLHTLHPPVAGPPGESAGVKKGFSGNAGGGDHRQPDRASVREGQAGPTAAIAAGRRDAGGAGDPLRGEQPCLPPSVDGSMPRQGASERPLSAWSGSRVPSRPGAPLPRELQSVLDPVLPVWERISRAGARGIVTSAVRAELTSLRGVLGPGDAERALAARLQRRIVAQGCSPVTDPVGWLLSRALPRRAGCYSTLCDEGLRMDTGEDCPSCALLVADRRALRQRVTAKVTAAMAGASSEALRRETDQQLQAELHRQASRDAARRKQAAAEHVARQDALARRWAEQEAAQHARRAQPCATCGRPDAAGRCAACAERGRLERAVTEAVEVTVAVQADLLDPAAVAALSARVTAGVRGDIEAEAARLRAAGADEHMLALGTRLAAELARDRAVKAALDRLGRSPEADAEVERASAARVRWAWHRRGAVDEGLEVVEAAAEGVRERTARALLDARLARVRAVCSDSRAPVARPRTTWAERCAELAARPLPGEREAGSAYGVEAAGPTPSAAGSYL